MTRAEAISLARSAAVARSDQYNYIPKGKLPDDWIPHEWVIDAIMVSERGIDDMRVEAAYWEFDARRNGYAPFTPRSERDAFKETLRRILAGEKAIP